MILAPLDEEEAYLLAILDDPSGIDLAEFCWVDEESNDGCYRLWDFQWGWQNCDDPLQADRCGRAVGKSVGIQMRAFAFPFNYAGQEMLITAPELNHLRPIVDKVEEKILSVRMTRELLPRSKGNGISRQPQWQARFANNSRIISRLPNKDGKGVKGVHATVIELDEAQDYPLAGWVEIIESRNRWSKNSFFRCHGVSRGVRDKFYEITQPNSGWRVHTLVAMHRPGWNDEERQEKINQYGGTRQNPDYKRNIYGEHGDATNPVFVLARLMACVDQDEASEYNADVYTSIQITFEQLPKGDFQEQASYLLNRLQLPGTHRAGHTLAPDGYAAYYAGMDVGMTNHPSELLVFGSRKQTGRAAREHLDLLTRVHLQRISTELQLAACWFLMDFYGPDFKAFGIDRTGLGFSMWELLASDPKHGKKVHGYNFSEKVIVGFEDRDLERGETMEDLAIERNIIEHATDVLRNDFVDPKRMTLPYDKELLTEWQGQNYTLVKSGGNPYGKRDYSRGKFHTLDAGKMAMAAKTLPLLDAIAHTRPNQKPVLDVFVGA